MGRIARIKSAAYLAVRSARSACEAARRFRGWSVAWQAGALLVLAVLVVGLLRLEEFDPDVASRSAMERDVPDGEIVLRGKVVDLPARPTPISNPKRIRRLLPAGKTYRVVVKGGLVGSAWDMDYQVPDRSQKVNLAFLFETISGGTIESNDGRRVVALVRFEQVKAVKLLSEAEGLALELGEPGVPVLAGLGPAEPEAGIAPLPVRPVAETILRKGFSAVAVDPAGKAFMQVGSLSGKTVRITYVDGVGVESVEPVGCRLAAADIAPLFRTPVLADAYILPDLHAPAATAWPVDGNHVAGLLDPSMRWTVCGTLTVEPAKDPQPSSGRPVALRVQGPPLTLTSLRPSRKLLGTFCPAGTVWRSADEGRLERAELKGPAEIYTEAEDDLLAYVRWWSEPTLVVQYSLKSDRDSPWGVSRIARSENEADPLRNPGVVLRPLLRIRRPLAR
jgi:hypothetical protein